MKKAKVIYNPTAGREQVQRYLPEVLGCLKDNGYETSAHATTGPGSATTTARLAAQDKFDLVLAAGGDGTIHEVVNGLAEQQHRPVMGIIPFGTTNDMASALGIPKAVEQVCQMLSAGSQLFIDVGSFNNRYFINIAAGGVLTELTYEVPSKVKTIIGQLAYYLKGIEKLPQMKAEFMSIEYDGKMFAGEVMLFLIANTNSVGGFNKLAPNAAIDDGLFDLIIIKKTTIMHFLALASAALRGEHINDPHIIYSQAASININSQNKIKINLDGEYGGVLPGRFRVLQHHLKLLVPKRDEP